MPSDDHELKAVKIRLDALVRCIIAKAESDTDFAEQLKEILLTDSLRSSIRTKPSGKLRRDVFDPVGFLAQNNEEGLAHELSAKTTSELRDIVRAYRIVAPKAAKTKERDELFDLVVTYALRKLDQGGVFNRSQSHAGKVDASKT
jgi:hypothetical protein